MVTVEKTECCTVEVQFNPVDITREHLQTILETYLRPEYSADIEVGVDE